MPCGILGISCNCMCPSDKSYIFYGGEDQQIHDNIRDNDNGCALIFKVESILMQQERIKIKFFYYFI